MATLATADPMTRPNWFLALPLPATAGWQQAAVTAPVGLRRFVAEDLHVTLAFLGPCAEPAALEAWQRIEVLASPPLRITAGGWRALGPLRQPSAYGITLAQGHVELVTLLEQWGVRALQAAGLPPPGRPPLPHVTLLRPRRREAGQWWGPMLTWMASAPLPPGALMLERLELWTWAEDRRRRLFRQVRCRSLG